jgi:hypothetical protein
MFRNIPYTRRVSLFFLLSMADFVLTWLLLQRQPESVYESNPVAGWFLNQFAWGGLAAFKAGTAAAVVTLIAVISFYRPRAGSLVLNFGCSALLGVVSYSGYLLWSVDPRDQFAYAPDPPLAAETDRLMVRLRMAQIYSAELRDAADDLVAGRCDLAEGVQRLSQTAKSKDAVWLAMLHSRYPNQSDEQCLADNLVDYTLGSLHREPQTARRLAPVFEDQFRKYFGPPAFAWQRGAVRGNS